MYVKHASTLIINWLLQNGCKLNKEAKITESKYLTYGDIKIRVSHHLPSSIDKDRIYIMVPSSVKEYYGVFVDRAFNTFSSMKELKNFLKSLFVITSCKSFAQVCKLKNEISQLENQRKQLMDALK